LSQNNRALRSNPNEQEAAAEAVVTEKGHKITEPYAQIPTPSPTKAKDGSFPVTK